METKVTTTTTQRNIPKRLSVWAMIVVAILMIPLLTKAPWTGSDYVFAGIVLSLCAITYEMITRNMSNPKQRAAVGTGVLFFIFMVIGWAASGP